MIFGFSKHVTYEKIIDACKLTKMKFYKMFDNQMKFCSKILLSIGFSLSDFKMGSGAIGFRAEKFCLLEIFFSNCETSEKPFESIRSFIWRSKWKCYTSVIRFMSTLHNENSQKDYSLNIVANYVLFVFFILVRCNKKQDLNVKTVAKSTQEVVHPTIIQESSAHLTKNGTTTANHPVDNRPKRSASPMTLKENMPPQKRQKPSEKRPNSSIRFNRALNHMPLIDKKTIGRCKNDDGCGKKTFIMCSVCKIHLCICVKNDRNCFFDYHTIPNNV